jgi:hypothetical protein
MGRSNNNKERDGLLTIFCGLWSTPDPAIGCGRGDLVGRISGQINFDSGVGWSPSTGAHQTRNTHRRNVRKDGCNKIKEHRGLFRKYKHIIKNYLFEPGDVVLV